MALSHLPISYDLLAPEGDGAITRSAVVQTKTLESALELKQLFHNKSGLTVDIGQGHISGQSSSHASSATSPAAANVQPLLFENFSPPTRTSPTNGNTVRNGNGHAFNHQRVFSPQSPIGKHLSSQPRVSSKSLINDAGDDDSDDILRAARAHTESASFMPSPYASLPEFFHYQPQGHRSYGNDEMGPTQRRATAPQLPLDAQMASLSLNTSTSSLSTAQHNNASMYPQSVHSTSMPPTAMNGSHQPNYHHHERQLPPANPADRNPPCNTLYVGNLPQGTSEDEIRKVFQSVRGYKRMCYRTKPQGPMCFVEFEDVGCATRALSDMYGTKLSTSGYKSGIRLSFSKNPLGVRNPPAPGVGPAGPMGGHQAMMGQATSGFATSGPPPGLAPLPPGLNLNRSASAHSISTLANGSGMPTTNGPALGGMTNGTSYAPGSGSGTGGSIGNGNFGFAPGTTAYERRADQRRDPRDTSREQWPYNYSTNGLASPPTGGLNGAGPFSAYGRVPRNPNF